MTAWKLHSTFACALMALTVVAISAVSNAEPASSLAGSWSGGGWVSFASGKKEKARCHAHYSRAGGTSYSLSATCATASGKASQAATVHQVSANHYQGSFHNNEYNISGTIRISVSGN